MSLTFFSRGAKRHSGMTSTHGRTPMYGSQTPMYGTGSRTPMYGSQTPLHDGESQPAADCYLSMIMKLTSCFFGLFARDIELFSLIWNLCESRFQLWCVRWFWVTIGCGKLTTSLENVALDQGSLTFLKLRATSKALTYNPWQKLWNLWGCSFSCLILFNFLRIKWFHIFHIYIV